MLRPDNPLVKSIQLKDFVSYLQTIGWTLSADTPKEYVFSDEIEGDKLEIILPKKVTAPDYPLYIAEAINLVGDLQSTSPEQVLSEIANGDRDVITVKVDDNEEVDGVHLDLAAQQITSIRNLVVYSACSEKKALPSFTSPANGKGIASRYRFGHTIAGSFTYKIYVNISEILEPQRAELPLNIINYPIERRITERIVRGIQWTIEAQKTRTIRPLITNYKIGLNANMCRALINLFGDKAPQDSIEFGFSWAHNVSLTEDLQKVRNLTLKSTSLEFLYDAERELKKIEPDYVEVRGIVVGLASNTPPLALDGDTTVSIRWDRGYGPSVEVRVTLIKKEYTLALEAHRKWQTVQVTGILEHRSTGYRLTDPRNFAVLTPPKQLPGMEANEE